MIADANANADVKKEKSAHAVLIANVTADAINNQKCVK